MFSNLLHFELFYNKKLSISLYFIDSFIFFLTYECLLLNSTLKSALSLLLVDLQFTFEIHLLEFNQIQPIFFFLTVNFVKSRKIAI